MNFQFFSDHSIFKPTYDVLRTTYTQIFISRSVFRTNSEKNIWRLKKIFTKSS